MLLLILYNFALISIVSRRVARIWKRGGGGGGAILKEWEKCKRPWPKFSLSLNQFHTVCPKIETKSESSEIQRFFPPKIRWSPKKKQVFTEVESDFSAEIRNSKVFSAQNKVVSKKKKVFTEIETHFSSVFANTNVWGGAVFVWGGGLFSIFHKKSASKAPKTCNFAYFTSQWGPAPLATLLIVSTVTSHTVINVNLKLT